MIMIMMIIDNHDGNYDDNHDDNYDYQLPVQSMQFDSAAVLPLLLAERPTDVADGADFKAVQHEVAEILRGRVLVGHSLKHDLRVLFLDHPKRDIRDTASYKPFRAAFAK